MNNNKISFQFILFVSISLLSIGCSQNFGDFSPNEHNPLVNETIFNSKKNSTQHWLINNKDTILFILDSLEVKIPEDLFIFENGEVVDKYYLFITPILKISDILLYNLQTITEQNILETKGMFHIDARSLKGNSIKFAENKSLTISYKTGNNDILSYNLFKGRRENNMIWELANNNTEPVAPYPPNWFHPDSLYRGVNLNSKRAENELRELGLSKSEASQVISTYQMNRKLYQQSIDGRKINAYFRINSFGWSNIDKIINDAELVESKNVGVNILNLKSNSIVRLFYLFKSRRTIIGGKNLEKNNFTINFSNGVIANIPQNQDIKAVIIAMSKDKYFVVAKDLDLDNGTNVKLKKIKEDELYDWLDSETKDY